MSSYPWENIGEDIRIWCSVGRWFVKSVKKSPIFLSQLSFVFQLLLNSLGIPYINWPMFNFHFWINLYKESLRNSKAIGKQMKVDSEKPDFFFADFLYTNHLPTERHIFNFVIIMVLNSILGWGLTHDAKKRWYDICPKKCRINPQCFTYYSP